MEEQELVKKCLRGNERAQKKLFDQYAPQMMTVCNRYANRNDQALDMLQEGFIRVFDKLGQYSGKGSLAGWIRSVVVSTSLTILRREKKFSFSEDIDDQLDVSSTSEDALSALAFEELLGLIQRLPAGYRTVFNLYAIEGFAHKEIAEKLGVTESTSKTQYKKAKAQLQKLIEENEG
ncbi:MAG: RNA polymerase sigma factor [Flavobacteriales bacterium]